MPKDKTYSSCISQKPFIDFGEGNAPVIDYTIPQRSCIPFTGKIGIHVDSSKFKKEHFIAPKGNFWDLVQGKPIEQIKTGIIRDLTSGISQSKYISNIEIAQKYQKNIGNISILNLSSQSKKGTAAEQANLHLEAGIKFDVSNLAEAISAGKMPVIKTGLSGRPKIYLIDKPHAPTPRIYLLEQYRICSFLGNYGMGKTISTFTLLPGERTTISVKTYKDIDSTRSKSENIVDSLTEASSEEFESTLKNETGVKSSSSGTTGVGVSAEISAGASFFDMFDASASTETSLSYTSTSARESFVNSLANSLDKHVSSSNKNRNVEVNTSSTETVKEGMELSTIRTIENINKSRVLNFVFRQLLQKHYSITYLSDIKIVYTNGYPESTRIVDLPNLGELLKEVIIEREVKNVYKQIINEICCITDYQDDKKCFVEKVNINSCNCWDDPSACGSEAKPILTPRTEFYWRKRKGLSETYKDKNTEFTVPGIILNVQEHVLSTPSILCEALLGRAEALDCYNQKLQDAATESAFLENQVTEQSISIINGIPDPDAKAKLYKAVFGSCCNAPQSACCNPASDTEGHP